MPRPARRFGRAIRSAKRQRAEVETGGVHVPASRDRRGAGESRCHQRTVTETFGGELVGPPLGEAVHGPRHRPKQRVDARAPVDDKPPSMVMVPDVRSFVCHQGVLLRRRQAVEHRDGDGDRSVGHRIRERLGVGHNEEIADRIERVGDAPRATPASAPARHVSAPAEDRLSGRTFRNGDPF